MKSNEKVKEMARNQVRNIGFTDTETGKQFVKMIENIAVYYYQEGYADAKNHSLQL